MPAELCGTSDYWTGWWTVTHNGEPVWHYPPDKRASPLIPPFGSSFTNKKMAHE